MKKTLLALAAVMATANLASAQDDLGYVPIEGDYEVTIPNCGGVFKNNGFSVSLYGTPVDDQGFVIGAGDVVNLEFYTDDPSTEGYKISGTYSYYDTQAWMNGETDVKYGPGDLMGGFIYEIMPGYAFPMGTTVTVYGEDNDETVGLAGPGSTLTISYKGDGVYKLVLDLYTPQNAHITGEWEGKLADCVQDCPVVDEPVEEEEELPYTPILGDYEVTIPNCGGVFMNNGFSVSLYGTPVDDQGFVIGAGDVVNLEFYTDDPSTEGYKISGTYSYYDTQAWMNGETDVKYGPGDLMGGFIYEIMPGYGFPMGTTVTVYGEDNDETVGLAGPGSTLTITYKGDDVYNLSLDLYTYQNAHITGEWEGVLKDCIQDFPDVNEESSGINGIGNDAGGSDYYDLQGVKVNNPQKGRIYIEVTNGRAAKVVK